MDLTRRIVVCFKCSYPTDNPNSQSGFRLTPPNKHINQTPGPSYMPAICIHNVNVTDDMSVLVEIAATAKSTSPPISLAIT